MEPSFQQDLNGDGTIGAPSVTIEASGATKLVQIGNQYFMQNSGGTGPALKYLNAAVTAGQFGPLAPIAAEQSTGGYELAWKTTNGSGQYVVWNTDSSGNYTTTVLGSVPGTSADLEALEPSIQQDLNGDGTIGFIPTQVIESFGTTSLWLVDSEYVLTVGSSSSTGVIMQDQGAPVIAGQRDTWVPIGAEQTPTGFEVAWKHGAADEYLVWNTDATGNLLSTSTAVVSGTNGAFEGLEPSFSQDLNGDGTIGVPTNGTIGTTGSVFTRTYDSFTYLVSAGPTATTVNIGTSPNTVFASSGLDAPSLTFVGTPMTVGVVNTSGAGIVLNEQAFSTVDLLQNFTLGLDHLTIFLPGSASGGFQAFDTSVGGSHAISLALSGDLTHGIVLLGMPTSQTAADLLANHTSFIGGGLVLIG